MEQQSVIHNTFVIEKSYPAKPERVFSAFADPIKKRRWFVEGENHTVESYEMDFREGGKEKAQFRFNQGLPVVGGLACTNETSYLDVVPNKRLVFASVMMIEGKSISASLCTIELLATDKGTDLLFTHQAAFFEGSDGPEMRKGGWEKLLTKLDNELSS
jgi:uncharacterized protein YndB with AHSA1/START domain